MVINRERLGCMLVLPLLLSLVGNLLAYRTAAYLLCPEPTVSLECFDLLRAGMTEDAARALLEPPACIIFVCEGVCMGPPPDRHREVQFRDGNLEIVLVFDDDILTDGRATVNGQVVRRHLEPRGPILDPIRQGLRRTEQQ